MNILDTSLIIELLRGNQKIYKKIEELEKEKCQITVFTIHEILIGSRENEIIITNELLNSFKTILFDDVAAKESAKIERELIKKGTMINKLDIFIAAICKINNATLITFDKDFMKIKDLQIEILA